MFAALVLATSLLGFQGSCCSSANGMAMLAADPTFLAFHLPPVAIHFVATTGRQVTYSDANGKPTDGFYVPPKPGCKAGVILVHEFWGLNDNIREVAQQLNDQAGYAVLAVDLYEGKTTTDPREAGRLMAGIDVARDKAIVKGAVEALRDGAFSGFRAKKVGSVGFCFGGGWSFETAVQGGKEVSACVVYYGMPDTSAAALNSLRAPVLFQHALQDPWINEKVVDDLAAKMKAINKPLTVYHYNAVHAFANPSNPKYDRVSAGLAWQRTLAFFKKHLG
jgi:carboxymethylenebutenolidase